MSEIEYSYRHEGLVAFKDTDMAGVVHFTQLLGYVEEAEHAAMLSVGVEPISGAGGFPKVHVDCDYRSPVSFGDGYAVKLGIEGVSDSSLRWLFEVVSGEGEKRVCEGSFVTVFVNRRGGAESFGEGVRSALDSLVIVGD